MIASRRSRLVRAALTIAIIAVVPNLSAGSAAAEGDRAGSAAVVETDGSALDRGSSSSPFTLQLPAGAACPGDSANDDYRIQSFVVPADVDPGGLTYESTKPAGDGRWALYAVTSDPFVQGLTDVAPSRGDPGLITGLPAFDFAVFPPRTLTEGVNRVGIACTLVNETVRYWDTEMVLTNTPADTPAQLTWVVPGAPDPSGSSPDIRRWIGIGALVLLVIGGAIAVTRRRSAPQRRSATTRSDAPSVSPDSRPKENSR